MLFVDRVLYAKNLFFVGCLLVSYLIPFLPYGVLFDLSILGLFYPLLLAINALCAVYWIVKFKKRAIVSLAVMALGYGHVFNFVSFGSSKTDHNQEAIKVMTYNVRLFNRYNWIKDDKVEQKINRFISDQNLDILCMQEFYPKNFEQNMHRFKYSHRSFTVSNGSFGMVIYTSYPIVNKGTVEFRDSYNQAIYADVAIGGDTIRVYNFHLESLKIIPDDYQIKGKNTHEIGHIFNAVNSGFSRHKMQAIKLREHMNKSPYKNIVCGDMNNTSLSYEYRVIKGNNMTDSFNSSSFGLASTFVHWYPLRIDFIFVNETFDVLSHIVPSEELSDHYPVIVTFK